MCEATVELGTYAAAAHDKETALAMRQAAHNISLVHAVCKLPPEFTGTRPSARHYRRRRQHTRPSLRVFTAHARRQRSRQIPLLFSHSAVDKTPNPCAYA